MKNSGSGILQYLAYFLNHKLQKLGLRRRRNQSSIATFGERLLRNLTSEVVLLMAKGVDRQNTTPVDQDWNLSLRALL